MKRRRIWRTGLIALGILAGAWAFAALLLPVLGVQWHPERQSYGLRRADAPGAEALFAYFAALIGGEPWTDPCGS